ncbi:hypothetical protein [Janthinobacterium psychrotolerans]|uniref:hypothetical protein n=1 Tax=Janthinobacterium psychrotolerans TaxID=1747903 RepID=UPI000806773D|nr:hypothetical protein [Janthinobacterium psychrotolerans]
MRFVFFDDDTHILFATTYDGDWDSYINNFATRIPGLMDLLFANIDGRPRHRQLAGQELYRRPPDHYRTRPRARRSTLCASRWRSRKEWTTDDVSCHLQPVARRAIPAHAVAAGMAVGRRCRMVCASALLIYARRAATCATRWP